MDHEQALVGAFVTRGKRDRYREILVNPRLRHKFTHALAHFTDFDFRYRIPIPGNKLCVQNIAIELKKRHCPGTVFIISEDPRLDRQDLPLMDALNRIVGRGIGCVISGLAGRLAFVETEDERFILERHDPLERREYIRFVVGNKDEDSHVESGVFQAAARALAWGQITGDDADELYDVKAWFNENLEKPTSFGRTKHSLGVCWFKTNAEEHISRIWKMVRILERNGIYVKKIRTHKPGYRVYEDEWQIVAEPFREGTLQRR